MSKKVKESVPETDVKDLTIEEQSAVLKRFDGQLLDLMNNLADFKARHKGMDLLFKECDVRNSMLDNDKYSEHIDYTIFSMMVLHDFFYAGMKYVVDPKKSMTFMQFFDHVFHNTEGKNS